MARRKRTAHEMLGLPAPRGGGPAAIEPTRVYRREEIGVLLRIGRPSIDRAVREGALRSTIKGRRQLFLGQWLLDYLGG
jgi:hypothetical protein